MLSVTGRGRLVDAAELGLRALGNEEHASAVGGEDAKHAKSVCDEPDKATGIMYALHRSGDVHYVLGPAKEPSYAVMMLASVCARLGIKWLVGERGLVVMGEGR